MWRCVRSDAAELTGQRLPGDAGRGAMESSDRLRMWPQTATLFTYDICTRSIVLAAQMYGVHIYICLVTDWHTICAYDVCRCVCRYHLHASVYGLCAYICVYTAAGISKRHVDMSVDVAPFHEARASDQSFFIWSQIGHMWKIQTRLPSHRCGPDGNNNPHEMRLCSKRAFSLLGHARAAYGKSHASIPILAFPPQLRGW